MMTRRKIYLSGKMTGLPNNGFEIFDKNRDFLLEKGWDVVSPADIDRALGFDPSKNSVFTEEQYNETIKRDYAALLECDSIAFMPNWVNSRGALLESNFANVLKLERYRVDANNLYFEKEMVIGLTGYARSGKNTIAEEFVNHAHFEQAGFSDSLKSILYSLNPYILCPPIHFSESNNKIPTRVQHYIDELGWDDAKSIPEIRQLLQRLGTEGGRYALGENVWIDGLFNRPHKAKLVISDLRFENEASAVRERGGFVIKVERPGVGPANDHSSENIDFDVDFTVKNDRTPVEAYKSIVEFLSDHGWDI